MVYGPGKPASPAWAAILADKPKIIAKQKPLKFTSPDYLQHSYVNFLQNQMALITGMPSESMYGGVTNYDDGYYAQVGKALGFTANEIKVLRSEERRVGKEC